jgi:hypothetical protein
MPAGMTRKWLRECTVPIASVTGKQMKPESRCLTIDNERRVRYLT